MSQSHPCKPSQATTNTQEPAGTRRNPQDHLTKLTPEERRLRAKVAAHTSWANTSDRSARTAPGRAAQLDRFLKEAGGDPQKAEHLRKAYMSALALKSAIARRKARELVQVAEQAEAELADGGAA